MLKSSRRFEDDLEFAWGFYGHRLNLYRRTEPHRGFYIMRQWADARPEGGFVFTSNVDGQFQKAGFEDVLECHGSLRDGTLVLYDDPLPPAFERCAKDDFGPCARIPVDLLIVLGTSLQVAHVYSLEQMPRLMMDLPHAHDEPSA